MTMDITFGPAAPERWGDVEAVIGDCGDARRCWCAYWYRANADYRAGRRDGSNRGWLAGAIAGGPVPGVIAYHDGRSLGWCGLVWGDAAGGAGSTAPVDDAAVWSITCFVVLKDARRQGLMRRLIGAAVEHARERGASIAEAYPLDLGRKAYPGELFQGSLWAFLDAGFVEVARRAIRPRGRRSRSP